ncbi:hypothetical protein RvY_00103 [Ramazzottius varieornatus]|uniref:Uncharacterized protein n=1 Tax=Ramazzottius varieornatus TaxID=947166 RepID=A0A1D1UFB9_RAMVA|nr:hypothetical protein RvY_00103 [Ramazzottius varieornatus]
MAQTYNAIAVYNPEQPQVDRLKLCDTRNVLFTGLMAQLKLGESRGRRLHYLCEAGNAETDIDGRGNVRFTKQGFKVTSFELDMHQMGAFMAGIIERRDFSESTQGSLSPHRVWKRERDFFNQQQGFNQPQQRNFNQQLQQVNYQPTQQTFNRQPGNDEREPPCVGRQVVQTYNQTQGFIQQHGQGFPAPPMLPPILFCSRKEDQRDKKTDMLIEIKKEPLEIENISPPNTSKPQPPPATANANGIGDKKLVDEFELSGPRLIRTVGPKRKNGFDNENAEVKITAKKTKK